MRCAELRSLSGGYSEMRERGPFVRQEINIVVLKTAHWLDILKMERLRTLYRKDPEDIIKELVIRYLRSA